MATRRVVLVRHGRSAHVVKGLLDRAAFLRWREAYEGAGIDPAEVAPSELCAAARQAAVVVSSDARRAIESARMLAPDREVIVSPLLRELSLEPLHFRRVRLPLFGWALTYGIQALRHALRVPATPEEKERVRAAAEWLMDLSLRHGEVIALTHGSFRSLLARELAMRGWVSVTPRRRSSHWSAWSFSPPGR